MGNVSVKAELLAELGREWAKIERTCYNLSEPAMVTPGVQGEWSVKDVLAHLSAWEKYLLDRLGYVLTGQQPHYPVMTSWDDVHRFNAQVYAENRDRPLTSVIIEFRSLYQGVVTVIEALSDEQLNRPYTYDFPDDHLTLLQLIRANTYEHYREHCEAAQSIGDSHDRDA
ncbi:MAG: hypothetical protein A2136_06495 [Chloroflexi bacterium RBG_16_54_11]|nr:MAG: hypothetical protein A2136_06495 [Chloroflexi bacterium RBG_16_54_11]